MFTDFFSPHNSKTLLAMIPLLPLLGFVINGVWGKKLSARGSGAIACAMILTSFLCAATLFYNTFMGEHASGEVRAHLLTWFNSDLLDVNLALRLDQLSAIMILVITGVGSLIHIYSVGYMEHDKGHWRFFAYLNLFCFAMLCLVLGDNLLVMFLGWEGVGLCSYLLIGFWYNDINKSSAGRKAFVANRVGDLGFLIGMFLIAYHFGTLTFTEINASPEMNPANSDILTAACLFLFVGATGKSAQIPLFVWLPDAMAGPTPVSALIHAATMVTAGVYMIARLNPAFALSPDAGEVIAIVGGVTALFAASIALVQNDIKKVLAYSTVSQLGFMFMAAGVGAYSFAVFHLVTHAFFKALLFLGSGSVIHSLEHGYGHGNVDAQDMRLMGGLRHKMPITFIVMMAGALALAGIIPFAGFFSKDEILLSASHSNTLVYALGVLAAAMTAFYTARMMAMTFWGKFRGSEKVWAHCHESPKVMWIPLAILAFCATFAGLLNLPHNFAHHKDHFVQFLAPVFEGAEAKKLEAEIYHEYHKEELSVDERAAFEARLQALDYEIQPADPILNSNTAIHAQVKGTPAAGEELNDIQFAAARIAKALHSEDAELVLTESIPQAAKSGDWFAQEAVVKVAEHAHKHQADHHKGIWQNMIISGLIAIIMFFIGWRMYMRDDSLDKAKKRAEGGMKHVYKLLLNKYYVDEIYEKLILKPIRVVASVAWVFLDMIVIDTMGVNGPAFATGALGHTLRRIQTGLVTTYLYWFAAGVIGILLYMVASGS